MEKLTFKVPEGTESIEQSLVDGCLVTKFIPKVEELKDLDCYVIKDTPNNVYGIFKDLKSAYVISDSVNEIAVLVYGEWEFDERWRKITRQEMQAELAKHGKYFDFEEKVLKNLRWRAKKNYKYFSYNLIDNYVFEAREDCYISDNQRFEIGNYHQTKEQCDEYAKKMIEYSKSLIK